MHTRLRDTVRNALRVAVVLSISTLLHPSMAEDSWTDSYRLALQHIDQGEYDVAARELQQLLDERPQPDPRAKAPGGQRVAYLPYYQMARVQVGLGDYSEAELSLDISEAFGAFKREKRIAREFERLRRTVRQGIRRDAATRVAEGR